MPALYVTSDRPSAGKTALISALAMELSSSGAGPVYFKPFSASPDDDPDVAFIVRDVMPGSSQAARPALLPDPGENGGSLSDETAGRLREAARIIGDGASHVLVEGPSLLSSEGDSSPAAVGVAELLDAPVVLIAHFRPGLDAGEIAGLCEPFGRRLLGILVNSVTPYRERETKQELGQGLQSRGITFLGAIPEDRLMLSPTVEQIAQHLDGQWVLGNEKSQDLVEKFLIGGNIMDSGESYFGRSENKAVIVRGDRPDIQLAALSTPTTCLVLTGGHQPIQYVHHQAEVENVPLLVVESDTMATAGAIEALLSRATAHHADKVARFGELLQRNADLGAIRSGL